MKMKSPFTLALAAVLIALPATAADPRQQEIEASLQSFDKAPSAHMNRPVKKKRVHKHTKFKEKHKQDVERHKHARRVKHKLVRTDGKEGPAYNDQAVNLVDKLAVVKLEDIEKKGLMKAQLAETPWSDDYWAIYADGAAKRYADPTINYSENWKSNSDQLRKAWTRKLTAVEIDRMSPAEKYDLLVGDPKHGLASHQIGEGAEYAKPDGSGVETWMGHCHGWGPAAYSIIRPKNKIVVLAADGKTQIPFYPADLRALSTILWANASTPAKFIGGRCNTHNPPQDANGRIIAAECRDINPATWHMAAVNQVGVAKRSMVLDVTFDYEVWNQPFFKYQYSYFNPKTKKVAATLAAAKAPKGFTGDKFAKYRSAKTATIVGIAMDVEWVVETEPGHRPLPTSARDDMTNGARYLYDLEIDAAGNVIGGEWYQNQHPDFLWTPPAGTHARSPNEPNVAAWNGKSALPPVVTAYAKNASPQGYLIGGVIEKLAARSALGN